MSNFIVFSESIACVDHISVSGKILYPLADLFFVQWQELVEKYPKAMYTGRLEGSRTGVLPTVKTKQGGYVLVTVGSTSFDGLIEHVDNLEFLELVRKLGYSGIHAVRERNVRAQMLFGEQQFRRSSLPFQRIADRGDPKRFLGDKSRGCWIHSGVS